MWEDRGWALVDEHRVPDLAERTLSILQQSKLQTQTRLCSAMAVFILTSRNSRSPYPKIATCLITFMPSLLLGEEPRLESVI